MVIYINILHLLYIFAIIFIRMVLYIHLDHFPLPKLKEKLTLIVIIFNVLKYIN